MGFWVWGAWIGAVVVAALVLSFCGYEIFWKARRLQTELLRLSGLTERLGAIQADVAVAQRRLADAAMLAER